jgi:hypothetical protein
MATLEHRKWADRLRRPDPVGGRFNRTLIGQLGRPPALVDDSPPNVMRVVGQEWPSP